ADELLVGGRVSAEPHQGVRYRIAQLAYQRSQQFSAFAHDHATAAVDNRLTRGKQNIDGFLDLARVTLGRGRVRADLHCFRIGIFELETGIGDVFRNVDNNRPRPAGGGNEEGLLDDVRNVL